MFIIRNLEGYATCHSKLTADLRLLRRTGLQCGNVMKYRLGGERFFANKHHDRHDYQLTRTLMRRIVQPVLDPLTMPIAFAERDRRRPVSRLGLCRLGVS